MPDLHLCQDAGLTEQPVHSLDMGGLLVVGAMRAWVAPLTDPGGQHPDWREMFRLAGLAEEAAEGFHHVMQIVAGHARRLIEVRCCQCPALGEDEVHMLTLVAALQSGEAFAPIGILSDWLPAELVGSAMAGAQRFATLLEAGGLRLPGSRRPALLH